MWKNWNSHIASGNVKLLCSCCEKNGLMAPNNLQTELLYDLAIALLGIYPKEYLYMNVHSSTIQNYKMEERTQMPIKGQVDQQMWSMHTMERYSAIKEMKC